jgi:hypothetical protein
MMVPRQRFRRISWLDHMVRRFQDRWETNPQYRAMISGVVGLTLILTLCTCTGLMTVVTNNALASLGLTNGSGNNINSTTGSGNAGSGLKFPTPTFGTLPVTETPVGNSIPSSQTPPPATTASPTPSANSATPTATGSGTNTAQFVCSGGGNGVTWTFSPCPLVHGQGGSITISTNVPAYKNASANVIVSFGACSSGNCTIDYTPAQFHLTNGVGVISFTVAANVQVGGPPVTGEINITGGPTVGINTVGSVT